MTSEARVESKPRPRDPAPTVARPRRIRSWTIPLLLLGMAILGEQLYDRIEASKDREPLRVVERAADVTGTPIGVITPKTANKWMDGAGPLELDIDAITTTGNALLRAVFLSHQDYGDGATEVDRCYYLPVQEERTFNPERAHGLMEICYLDPYPRPQSKGVVSIED